MTNYQITPERKAHLYAIMAWSDKYTKEEAEQIAYTTEYGDLNNISYAEKSISTAKLGVMTMIETGKLSVNAQNTPAEWAAVIKILIEIHNTWVQDYPEKYNRGNPEKSNNNLFQHLPTALIGIDELAKDLMFLAPFLEELGLNAGEMDLVPYGAFKPSEELILAYNSYIEKYMVKHSIKSITDLISHIQECIDGGYAALIPQTGEKEEIAKLRIDYMREHVDILVKSVTDKNQELFGSLPLTRNVGC